MANVLIIDDDERVLETFQIVLSSSGRQVQTASNGALGIEATKTNSFDIVVTDVVMPEKDGLEVLMQMRKTHPDTKIVVVSGGGRTSATDYLKMAEVLGADRVLYKPVTATELSVAIEELSS